MTIDRSKARRMVRGQQATHACGQDLPNAQSCLRLIQALAIETHEKWLEAIRYLNMEHLKEHKKDTLKMAARTRCGITCFADSHVGRSVAITRTAIGWR